MSSLVFSPEPTPTPARLIRALGLARWLLGGLLIAAAAHAKVAWDPVSAEDLAARDSTAAPGTDTEILFSRHVLMGDYTENHVRAKVYTRKGVEKAAVLSIDHGWNGEISHLVARVVKPSGAAIELKKSEFHETVRFRQRDNEYKRTTFAFPSLEPGDIVEYRWRQDVPPWSFAFFRFFCQAEEVFTREYSFDVNRSDLDFSVSWSNCPTAEHDPKGHKLTIRNLPPFVREPHMPAEAEFRGTISVVFTHPWMRSFGFGAGWPEVGHGFAQVFKDSTAPKKAVKLKAAALTAGAANPQEAVARIYRFVQTEIKNLNSDSSPALAAARKRRERTTEPQSPAETLEERSGNTWDITLLFASLVRAAGYEVRLGMNANHEQIWNIRSDRGWAMADRRLVVVNFGERFGFYTPGDDLVPCGLLSTKDEGAMVYVCGDKEGVWVNAPVALPAQTKVHRAGHFTLADDGSLDGDVEIELNGHRAIEARALYRGKSPEESLKKLREQLVERLVTAEPSDFTCQNLDDTSLPLLLRFKVHIPGYAESAGSRLVFPINFFTANTPVVFTGDTRHYPVFLGFAEQCLDDIELTLPDGYELDGASAPPPIGDASAVIYASYSVNYWAKSRKLAYHRERVIGGGGYVVLKAEAYPLLRQVYDRIRLSDVHQIVLKPAPAAPPVSEPAPVPSPAAP